ncbi:oligoendopeptidase F [Bacillus thuringiensis]|uniref:oligoendopeptidase F n=1 Tax=Bacillus thuringiensis TaxID=1428 RepID=UPI000BFCB741|nr:oligoendopeptidase F [Bacillus thuringiensis]PGR73109.1 oligoendopeptidase F [Bacillus thuringiensis]
MSTLKEVPTRSEIDVLETWDLNAMFNSEMEWEKEFNDLKEKSVQIAQFEGKVIQSADLLLKVLDEESNFYIRFNKLRAYAHMRLDEDITNPLYQDLNQRAIQLMSEVNSKLTFINSEILEMSQEKFDDFLKVNPSLSLYKFKVNEVFRKREYLLDKDAEKILAQFDDLANNSKQTFGMLNNADMPLPIIEDENGEQIRLSHGRFTKFLESSDRKVRKDAFNAMLGAYGNYKNTFASTLNGVVKRNNVFAKIRGYKSARQAAMHEDNISEDVYETLISVTHKHLGLLRKYVELRKKLLGIDDELHMYDLMAPISSEDSYKVTYTEAKKSILSALSILGEDYYSKLKKGFEERWIDVHETKGKRNGAYSAVVYGEKPYILLNWQGKMSDMFTLAHELGHSMHSLYSHQNQPFVYANYPVFVAEIASTCNEILLNQYMINVNDDVNQKLHLLVQQLEGLRIHLFRQTMFAEFEHLIHEKSANGQALTAQLLTNEYILLNKKYFGDSLILDDEVGYEWARIPHLYFNYYVYQYATGYCAAAAFAKKILEGDDQFIHNYIEFLKAGSSDYPVNLLEQSGLNLKSEQYLEDAFGLFGNILKQVEILTNTVHRNY